MISICILFTLVIIASAILKSPWFKGVIGEYKVNSLLEDRLDKKDYRIIKDVLLRTEDGTTQIDHIVVSKYGIFVIETKNMSHWIFANNGPYWTQTHYKKKSKFQNPIRQNYKHVITIENLLDVPKSLIFNTVVFSGDCEFKTDVEKNVMKLSGLIPYIISFQNEIIDESKINTYVKKINKSKLENTISNKIKHIRHIDNIKISDGNDGGIFQKLFIKYSYKIALPLIFILLLLAVFDNIFNQSSKMFSNIITNNFNNQNKIKQNQQTSIQQQPPQKSSKYASQAPQQVNEPNENKIITPKEQTVYKGAIYSWTNERGQRVSSNVGFPTDRKYTDPKIEWHQNTKLAEKFFNQIAKTGSVNYGPVHVEQC